MTLIVTVMEFIGISSHLDFVATKDISISQTHFVLEVDGKMQERLTLSGFEPSTSTESQLQSWCQAAIYLMTFILFAL